MYIYNLRSCVENVLKWVINFLKFISEQHMAMVDNLKEFKKMLIGIEPNHPNIRSSGLDFFNTTQAKRIATYINTRFLISCTIEYQDTFIYHFNELLA